MQDLHEYGCLVRNWFLLQSKSGDVAIANKEWNLESEDVGFHYGSVSHCLCDVGQII